MRSPCVPVCHRRLLRFDASPLGLRLLLGQVGVHRSARGASAQGAAMHLSLQTAEGMQRPAPWLERARRATTGPDTSATERERACYQAVAERWPRELLSTKIAQVHQINPSAEAAETSPNSMKA